MRRLGESVQQEQQRSVGGSGGQRVELQAVGGDRELFEVRRHPAIVSCSSVLSGATNACKASTTKGVPYCDGKNGFCVQQGADPSQCLGLCTFDINGNPTKSCAGSDACTLQYSDGTGATYGTCGVKVWIFKGEILAHDPMAQDRRAAEQAPQR